MPSREDLGRLVRQAWVQWAYEQPVRKPSWLVPWCDLSEPQREVDRRIGERIATVVADDLRTQRDELVAALERLLKNVDHCKRLAQEGVEGALPSPEAIEEARATLAKAKETP